ncbi:hypothetical protein DPV78_012944 [Talaromyces pinophilus]|nr:hypothetical protein DPV78_012944 [Talaromyces pinophilus]
MCSIQQAMSESEVDHIYSPIHATEEMDPTDQLLDAVDRAILTWCIAMLDHPLQDRPHINGLVGVGGGRGLAQVVRLFCGIARDDVAIHNHNRTHADKIDVRFPHIWYEDLRPYYIPASLVYYGSIVGDGLFDTGYIVISHQALIAHYYIGDDRELCCQGLIWVWLHDRIWQEPGLRRAFIHAERPSGISTTYTWRPRRVQQWMRAVGWIKEYLLVLIHLTSGAPAHSPEAMSIWYQNILFSGLRNQFIKHRLVSFMTTYHKGYHI